MDGWPMVASGSSIDLMLQLAIAEELAELRKHERHEFAVEIATAVGKLFKS